MQKVVLVDDEFIILDGISSVIAWESLGTELIGTAHNGLEALELIKVKRPDIVITDIRMPGMDGLELVEQVMKLHPDTSFIMLTGFSEFDYAKTAMQHGVKHYLLKPCSEMSLNEALREIVYERKERKDREDFFAKVKYGLERVMPYAKEQLLKEMVTNKTYGVKDWSYFVNLFGLEFQSHKVRLVLIELEGRHEYEHLFAIRNIAGDCFQDPMLSTTVGGRVLLMVEDKLCEDEWFAKIYGLRDTFMHYYRIDLTAALSESGELSSVRRLYTQTLECLGHRFYLGEGSLITEKDISVTGEQELSPFQFDPEHLTMQIKAGHWEGAEQELMGIIGRLSEQRYHVTQSKSYLIQIYMEIIRLGEMEKMQFYLGKLPEILETSTLPTFQDFMLRVARDISISRYEKNRCKQSQVVQRIRTAVSRRYTDESLSLQALAAELYMNPDYIGKIFKKETGERFTSYVSRYRMEKALELIAAGKNYSVTELAEATGFGDNASYFSKLFKKFTGFAPSEYKKTT